MNFSLSLLFILYGFTQPPQQQALVQLLSMSNAFSSEILKDFSEDLGLSLEKKKAFQKECAKFREPSSFNADTFLQNFLQGPAFTPHDAHIWFVYVTQRLIFARLDDKRENHKAPSWTEGREDDVIKHIMALDILKEMPPKFKEYDAVVVLGSSDREMINRLNYLKDLINSDRIQIKEQKPYLSTGQRLMGPIDGRASIEEVSKATGKKEGINLMETDAFKYRYAQLAKENPKLAAEPIVIDTPATNQGKDRPTTFTTAAKFKEYLKDNNFSPKKVLVISQNPYIYGQEQEFLRGATGDGFIETVDVVGPARNIENLMKLEKSFIIKYALDAQGGGWFGGFRPNAEIINEHAKNHNALPLSEKDLSTIQERLSFRGQLKKIEARKASESPVKEGGFVEKILN